MIYITTLTICRDGQNTTVERAQSIPDLTSAAFAAANGGATVTDARWRDAGDAVRSAGCLLCGRRFGHRHPGVVYKWYRKHDCTKEVPNG